MTEKKKNLIIRTITGVLFVGIIVSGFLRPEAMIALFALITGLTMWEYTGLVNEYVPDVRTNRFISTIAGVYLFIAVALWRSGVINGFAIMVPYVLTIIYLFITGLYSGTKNVVNDWAYTMLGQMYIALPFSMINILAFEMTTEGGVNYNMFLPLSVFIFLWTNDTGAYCTGSLIGQHKLAPHISPAKTWEGSIGGSVFVLVAVVIMSYCLNRGNAPSDLNTIEWIGLGLVVSVFGTWGDLIESQFKRTLGIKDSGHILPGHGGMLDRFDSALMAFPAVVIYLYSLSLF